MHHFLGLIFYGLLIILLRLYLHFTESLGISALLISREYVPNVVAYHYLTICEYMWVTIIPFRYVTGVNCGRLLFMLGLNFTIVLPTRNQCNNITTTVPAALSSRQYYNVIVKLYWITPFMRACLNNKIWRLAINVTVQPQPHLLLYQTAKCYNVIEAFYWMTPFMKIYLNAAKKTYAGILFL